MEIRALNGDDVEHIVRDTGISEETVRRAGMSKEDLEWEQLDRDYPENAKRIRRGGLLRRAGRYLLRRAPFAVALGAIGLQCRLFSLVYDPRDDTAVSVSRVWPLTDFKFGKGYVGVESMIGGRHVETSYNLGKRTVSTRGSRWDGGREGTESFVETREGLPWVMNRVADVYGPMSRIFGAVGGAYKSASETVGETFK
ncbi:MAG: hypothetical protein ABH864_05435 [archaeon]